MPGLSETNGLNKNEVVEGVALVTGGAQRVGRAIALELARAGYDLSIHYLSSHREAESLAAEIRALGRRAVALKGDLAEPFTWSELVARTTDTLGRLDVLVNNASLFLTPTPDTLAGFNSEEWERMLRVNLIAPVGLCHHAAPHLAKGGDGCVVNLCDISAERPWPDHLAYAASKAGLVAMTKALARSLAPAVRVNGVAPGIAIFPASYTPEMREKLIERVPLKRAGTLADIARTVRFLCAPGSYVTGQVIGVDGGRSVV